MTRACFLCSLALLIAVASRAGAQPAKKEELSGNALKAAEFESVRGKFKFNTNNHPIQDIYVREVVKEGDVLTNRVVGVAMEDHADAYAGECQM